MARKRRKNRSHDPGQTEFLCFGCDEVKTASSFYKNKDNKQGLDNYCKMCRKARNAKNKEASSEYHRAYHEAHKAERIAYAKARYRANKEDKAKYDKSYRVANRDKIRARAEKNKEETAAYRADYYKKNRDAALQYAKEYARENADKIKDRGKANRYKTRLRRRAFYAKNKDRARDANRKYKRLHRNDPSVRAAKVNSEHKRRNQMKITNVTTDWLLMLRGAAIFCVYCMRPFGADVTAVLDHIVPISKGGMHTRDNVQYICSRCNGSKWNRPQHVWHDEKVEMGTAA